LVADYYFEHNVPPNAFLKTFLNGLEYWTGFYIGLGPEHNPPKAS